MQNTHFQFCQKLVIFNVDFTKTLLAKRKGEADYNSVYSFIGGKMDTSDSSILNGILREKIEEIGENNEIIIYPNYVLWEYFEKKDKNKMILPHYCCIFKSGTINLNEDEYSDFEWADVSSLDSRNDLIPTIPKIVKQMIEERNIILKLKNNSL